MGIRAENISKTYGSVKALQQVSLEAIPGELFGLIGPDGAGKTTFLRILTTLLLPDKGTATVNGLQIHTDYRTIRKITGYMPGRFSLYQDLTVEENLQFFASVFDQKFDENFELIKDIYLQLAPFKNRRAGKLSGGMKQKLALCCALIHKPSVLILDEPTTGVDAVSRNEFWDMLTRLKEEGITIMVSTPYMDEATRCDRLALIQKGRILQIDTPGGIIGSFRKRLFEITTLQTYKSLLHLKDMPRVDAVYPFGQSLHLITSDDGLQANTITDYLAREGMNDAVIMEHLPNIEDCFMELMHYDNTR